MEPEERFLHDLFGCIGVNPEEDEIAAQRRLLAVILVEHNAIRGGISRRHIF
jgi:hypothetical protein